MDPDLPLRKHLTWLIGLRWPAVVAIVAGSTVAVEVLHLPLPLLPLQACGLLLAACNAGFRAWLSKTPTDDAAEQQRALTVLADVQLIVDVAVLLAIVHLTGGARSPLAPFLLFPTVFAGLTLPPTRAYAHAGVVVVLYGGLLLVEGMYRPSPHGPTAQTQWLPGELTVFGAVAAAVSLTTYATVFLSSECRLRQAELASLTEELARQAGACHVAYAELQNVQDNQVRYMQRVAHELKSPLSAISMMLQAASDALPETVPAPQREMLQRAAARARSALQLTDDLLTLSEVREAASSAPPAKISLSHLIESLLDEQQVVGVEQGVVLVADIEDGLKPVLGYRSELIALLRNLISNAVKYSPEGGRVTIRARSGPRDVVLEVADQGMGIEPDEIPRLFEEFYRSPAARAGGIGGTGLGLAIVKSVVDRHQGSVTVESRPGEGTTFRVRLPAPDPAPTWGPPGERHPGRETE